MDKQLVKKQFYPVGNENVSYAIKRYNNEKLHGVSKYFNPDFSMHSIEEWDNNKLVRLIIAKKGIPYVRYENGEEVNQPLNPVKIATKTLDNHDEVQPSAPPMESVPLPKLPDSVKINMVYAHPDCPYCLSEYEGKTYRAILPCGHELHEECLKRIVANGGDKCIECKQSFM